MGFYDKYERFTMSWLRGMSKVPGLKKYARWNISKYEKNFWRSAWTSLVITTMITKSIDNLAKRVSVKS